MATVPIVYGKPSWEIEEAVKFGLVITGVFDDNYLGRLTTTMLAG